MEVGRRHLEPQRMTAPEVSSGSVATDPDLGLGRPTTAPARQSQ